MNNVFVYCEITEENHIADVSLELISKARKLADELKVKVEAIVAGNNVADLEGSLYPYGVDIINYAEDKRLFPYQTLPHFSIEFLHFAFHIAFVHFFILLFINDK